MTPGTFVKLAELESAAQGAVIAGEGFITKDSGVREAFDTGAVRDTRSGKGRFDLLPALAMRRLAQVYERGALKYADRNWEKGMSFSRCLDSAMRHSFQYAAGQRDEDHLLQAVFNLMAIAEYEERIKLGQLPPELNDLRPTYEADDLGEA